MSKFQSIRGMNDCLPAETPAWQYIEATVANVMQRYGYREIRVPLLESTELFKRSIGEVTDIVEKEMYTFRDRNDESITLRPEGTAGVVRACEQHGLLYNQIQKLWYCGPMFRYEKPQKGRLRQFHQIGAEAFGMTGPDIDAELLLMTARFWQELGVEKAVSLQLNSLGTSASRARYRDALVDYLNAVREQLDEDSQRRLDKNPLRILDSKDKNTQALLDNAPNLLSYLDAESQDHFDSLRKLLDSAGIAYAVNPRLVRGLDYYCLTVFEWVTDALGAQGTVCAGGRYDGLVQQLGGKPTPAVGFAMGLERLTMLVEVCEGLPSTVDQQIDVYVVAEPNVLVQAMMVAESLRAALPSLRLQLHCGGGSIKSQMKKADKSGAVIALIIGENEVAANVVALKYLRAEQPQQTLTQEAAIKLLQQTIN